jgi:hypothetical protein
MSITLIVLELCPRQSSKCKNKQRAKIQKLGKEDLCTAYLFNKIYLPTKFHVNPLIVLELCPGQSSKYKNKQRAIIQKLGKEELRF